MTDAGLFTDCLTYFAETKYKVRQSVNVCMSCGTVCVCVCVSVKVSVDQDQWSHQCPHIQSDADPAGGDLHPHRWPLAGHGLVVRVGAAETGETDT